MPLPEWWLLMAKRGVPYHPDVDVAMQVAKRRVATYRGKPGALTPEQQQLVQGIALDALVVAPQPVGPGWVNTTLMAVGSLVQWAVREGEDLDRENLFDVSTRTRFLNLGCAGLKATSVTNCRTRLDLIAMALSGVAVQPSLSRKGEHEAVVDPHTATEVATLWMWARGLRPRKRNQRMAAAIALGLGCGLRSREAVLVRPEHVTRDENGVHVRVVAEGAERTVTCTQAWEERLWQSVEETPAGRLVTSPWREDAVTARMLQNVVREAQITAPAPVLFSMRSLRNTWMVQHLTLGVPVPTLLDAAGVESIEALGVYLPHVPDATTAERAGWLRGAP